MVRDLLKRVRKCRYMVDACIKDLEQARRDAYTLKAVRIGDKVQNNHQSDLAQVVEKIERYEDKLQKNIDELIGPKGKNQEKYARPRPERRLSLRLRRCGRNPETEKRSGKELRRMTPSGCSMI